MLDVLFTFTKIFEKIKNFDGVLFEGVDAEVSQKVGIWVWAIIDDFPTGNQLYLDVFLPFLAVHKKSSIDHKKKSLSYYGCWKRLQNF